MTIAAKAIPANQLGNCAGTATAPELALPGDFLTPDRLVGQRHVAEQRDESEHQRVDRKQRHVALDDVAPFGGQHAGDGVRIEQQGQRGAESQGGEDRQLALAVVGMNTPFGFFVTGLIAFM